MASAACATCPRPSARAPTLDASLTEIEEATIAGLTARMQRGTLGARELVERYLARIDALDVPRPDAPSLRAVVEVNPDARRIADELDRRARAGGARGPLHGIPILLKDNIDTADRMQTTAGSLALMGAPARRDALIVQRLRAAGAVILGKTNLSEWANIRDRKSVSGWSARGGFTRNPYLLDHNPSGSSSGSAVAVSANLAAVAVGTETVGSIIGPAAHAAVVGLKSTAGLLPTEGIVPISHTQDTPGPMARTVADAALVQAVLAGVQPPTPPRVGERLEGARIGVRRGMSWPDAAVRETFERALEDLRRLGAVLVDGVGFPAEVGLERPLHEVLMVELAVDLGQYLAERAPPSGVRTVADVVGWNRSHAAEELVWFGQDLFEEAAGRAGDAESPSYLQALSDCRRIARQEGLESAFARERLDALVAPSAGSAWVTDPLHGDHFTGGSARLAAVAGYPSITVPSGAIHGLPLGISLVGPPRSEATLLRLAAIYEQATRQRRRPTYRASV